MKIRKKPIILDAWQLVENYDEVDKPIWVQEALDNNDLFLSGAAWYVDTLEGVFNGKIGDILIKGIEDELYICDKAIFDKTYDIVIK